MQEQHPVGWLLDKMDVNLYPALLQWIQEIMEAEPLSPSTVNMPDWSHIQTFVVSKAEVRIYFQNNHIIFDGYCHLNPIVLIFGCQERAQQITFSVPISAFTMKMPADGLPMMEDWLLHSSSIWSVGYESWRESVEIKPVDPNMVGRPLAFGCVEPTKGSGRISMLLFTIWYSYFELKNVLVEGSAERDEFCR